MIATKQFHIGDVISITDGHLVSSRGIAGVYDILNWMSGEDLMTHQLPRVADECRPFLRQQHPKLAAIQVPFSVNSRQTADAFLATLFPQFGETVAVAPLTTANHTKIDPITEIEMIRPGLPIIVIGTDR